jgi:hypothetical protein
MAQEERRLRLLQPRLQSPATPQASEAAPWERRALRLERQPAFAGLSETRPEAQEPGQVSPSVSVRPDW